MKWKLFSLCLPLLVTVYSVPLFVSAETDAGLQPQSYAAERSLQAGTVVQIADTSGKSVKAATLRDLDKAFGVVVSTNSLPISISDISVENQVHVATNGRRNALVTTENGSITAGDLLAVSSLNGTLMKATASNETVFAKALSNFDGKSGVLGTATLKDTSDKAQKNVAIGSIAVTIGVVKNPQIRSTTTNLPSQLQRVGQAVAEKPVSGARLYIGTAIAFLSIVIALVIQYVGIRSSIISIGRNPLASKSVLRALIEVMLTSILVLLIGLFTVYLILRL
jgi:hypothetical protein